MTRTYSRTFGAPKADFDRIYIEPDPRLYFVTLGALDYVIPDVAGPVFEQLVRARKEALGGLWADEHGRAHLKASVRAVPEKGLANKALIALLAKQTGTAKSLVTLESGSTSRSKVLALPREAAAIIDRLLQEEG